MIRLLRGVCARLRAEGGGMLELVHGTCVLRALAAGCLCLLEEVDPQTVQGLGLRGSTLEN